MDDPVTKPRRKYTLSEKAKAQRAVARATKADKRQNNIYKTLGVDPRLSLQLLKARDEMAKAIHAAHTRILKKLKTGCQKKLGNYKSDLMVHCKAVDNVLVTLVSDRLGDDANPVPG